MADRKISELLDNPSPGADTASVPIIEQTVVAGSPAYSQFRTTVKNLVVSGVNADGCAVDGGNF